MEQRVDALNDPALTGNYREPRSEAEICNEKHAAHMLKVDQKGWLKKLFDKADKMKAEQERIVTGPALHRQLANKPKAVPTKKRAQPRPVKDTPQA